MGTSSAGFHESEEQLSPATRDLHRAIVSLMEELRAILAHNWDEEKEHAAMVLEWLRRKDATLDARLREYLFSGGPIVGCEEALMGRTGAAPSAGNGATVGSLRGVR
jgi:hypothetical protein